MNSSVIALAAAMCATAPSLPQTTLHLDVPAHVANRSAIPILHLEDVEIGAGEGLTIDVYDENKRTILGVAALIGERQAQLQEPRERMTLVIPLNEAGSRAVDGKNHVVLHLVLRDSPGREPLQLRRALFE
jgi:hypothetical protein